VSCQKSVFDNLDSRRGLVMIFDVRYAVWILYKIEELRVVGHKGILNQRIFVWQVK
jgi:hypothetical protein